MKSKLIVRLEQILANPDTTVGICKQLGEGYSTLEFLLTADGWPKHSGRTHYPIPATPGQGYDEVNQFHNYPLWEGEQLELRVDLIKYVLSKLNED